MKSKTSIAFLVVLFAAAPFAAAQPTKESSKALEGLSSSIATLLGLSPDVEMSAASKLPLADQFASLPASVPAVGIIPFASTTFIGPASAAKAQDLFIRSSIEMKAYRPYSAKAWSETAFAGQKADTMLDIARAAKVNKLFVKYLITGKLFQSGDTKCLRIARYDIERPRNAEYFIRYFKNDDSELPQKIRSLLIEMRNRPPKDIDKDIAVKRILIRGTKNTFYVFSELTTGEFKFDSSSFIKLNEVDYRTEDDFIPDLMAYILSASQAAEVLMPDCVRFVSPSASVAKDCDYVVDLALSMTRQLTVLQASVNDAATSKKIFSMAYPIRKMEMGEVEDTLRTISRHIIYALTKESERLRIGTATFLGRGSTDIDVFCNGYYMGTEFSGQVLPVGLNVLSFRSWDWVGGAFPQNGKYEPVGVLVNPFGDTEEMKNYESLFFNAMINMKRSEK